MTGPKRTSRRDGTAADPETPHLRPLGQWLVETMPRGGRKPDREAPFAAAGAE